MLEKKEIKEKVFGAKKVQPVEAMVNRLNRLRNQSIGCARPIEDQSRDAKKFLSLLVAFSSRSRFDLGNGNMSSIKCSDG